MNTYLINSISNIIQVCTIEWMTPVHDGPVQEISKNPFMPHLLMSVGGYSFAVWNEGVMVMYIVCKSNCITLKFAILFILFQQGFNLLLM